MNGIMTFASVILDWLYIPLMFAYMWYAAVNNSVERQKTAIRLITIALIVACLDMGADFLRGKTDGSTIGMNLFSVVTCIVIAVLAMFTLNNMIKNGVRK